jgi:hypothetical protein
MIGQKVPNNYINVSKNLSIAAIKFWKFSAFFMDNLKIFGHYYMNTIIIKSFIYCIYQRLRANFESYLTP